jgi:muramidase (phage lysozyme)
MLLPSGGKMTKTKLLGGILGMVIVMSTSLPSIAVPAPNQVYAKSAPTATKQVVVSNHEYRMSQSKDAKDMMGYEESLYKGQWYDSRWESTRKCIMHRESRFNYRSANKTSSARGAYQFLDNFWRDGLVWMMLKESKESNDGLSKDIKKLRDKPIHKWNRYYQDRAFFTAWRHGAGKKHWYHFNSNCI